MEKKVAADDGAGGRRARGGGRANGAETKRQLKIAAQRLFAERGFDGVTVQQITAAAGQRNNASLHYHFGSKEELARQLVVDGAQLIDGRRQAMLDALEAAPGPMDRRAVMLALVLPVASLGDAPEERSYLRFIANLQFSRRQLLREALGARWNAGYRRCLAHLRRLTPEVPPALLEQRLSLTGIYGNAILAAREEFMESRRGSADRFWGHAHTLENIVDTLLAAITCPPSPETLAALAEDGAERD